MRHPAPPDRAGIAQLGQRRQIQGLVP